jgi:hypothetical protein
VLSHIDNDHVTGLLDLLHETGDPMRSKTAAELPRIGRLWHNSFAQAVGSAELEPAVRAALASAAKASIAMPALGMVMRGVAHGDALRASAIELGIRSMTALPTSTCWSAQSRSPSTTS